MFLNMIIGSKRDQDVRKYSYDYKELNETSQDNILNTKEEYDEDIRFFHHKLHYGNFEYSSVIEEFPFLTNNEYLISEFSSSTSGDKFSHSSDSFSRENLKNIRVIIKQFINSEDIKFKQLFLENLPSYVEKIGLENTSDLIIPLLSKIIDEPYSLKKKLMEIYPKLIEVIRAFSTVSSYNLIKDDLLKIVTEMLEDKSEEDLLKLSSENFVLIAESFSGEDVANLILATVIGYAVNMESNESNATESKALAGRLFGDLASILGRDLCESYVVPQLSFLVDDKNFKVRKSVVLSLLNISQVLSCATITTKILPIYINLCNDNLWTIRKACVEILPNLLQTFKEKSNYSSGAVKSINEKFLILFDNFILDSQKFVRVSLLHIFGPFIAQLAKEELKPSYIEFFKNSLEEYYFNVKDFGLDNQSSFYFSIKYYFAYNLPAVVYCYGKEYWPQLKKVYAELTLDNDIEIIRCIISSFHELVKLLDEVDVENDLLVIFDRFLKSTNEEIKSYALKKLPLCLKNLRSDLRLKYRNYFRIYSQEFMSDEIEWRGKLEIVENYENYFKVFEMEIIIEKMIPLIYILCKDEIFLVRKKSSKLLSKMFLHVLSDEKNSKLISKYLQELAENKNFKIRTIFVYVSKYLILNEFTYKEILKYLFKGLVSDKIIDVRISVAKFFSKVFIQGQKIVYKETNRFHLYDDLDFINMCYLLSKDNKKSVRNFFDGIEIKNTLDMDKTSKVENVIKSGEEISPNYKEEKNYSYEDEEMNHFVSNDFDNDEKSINPN